MVSTSGNDIYKILLAAIEQGDLKPGARLREAELAENFGVSRTPIREGLKRLEAQGLAIHQPNRGMVIPTLDNDQLNELYVVRAVLEGTVARLAAQHASDAEISILRDMMEEDQNRDADAFELAAANRIFHRRLTLAAHNSYLSAQIDHMKQALLLLDGTTFVDENRRRSAIKEHAAIVEAIEARDLDKAEAAARHHIHEAHKARLRQG